MGAEFESQVAAVAFDGLGGEAHSVGDLVVGEALDDQPQQESPRPEPQPSTPPIVEQTLF